MDPVGFTKHNRVTNVFAQRFIEEIIESMPIGRESKLGLVMDVGCGSGNASTLWIEHYLPSNEKLVGVDFDPEMIILAKELNKKDNFEFHVADIMDRNSLKKWEGSVDMIFSHFVLNRVKDQKCAVENIFNLLECSGSAALHFIVKCPYYTSCVNLHKNAKWKPILEPTNQVIPDSCLHNYEHDHYKQMFKDVGFKVDICKMITRDFSFESDDECKNFLVSLHSIGNVSEELKEEFKNDLFEEFMKHSPRDSDGRPTYAPTVLLCLLQKEVEKESA